MSGGRPFSPRRFRVIAMHVLAQCKQGGVDPRDLWEIMFDIDMEMYRRTGKSGTGAVWVKTPEGVRPRRRGEASNTYVNPTTPDSK